MGDRLNGCAAVQRDFGSLEKWAERNLVKSKKRKCQVLPLGRNNPTHQDRLGTKCLERSSAVKVLGMLMDIKLTMNQQM